MSRLILQGLEARQREGRRIRVGVMGAGEFGRALVTQLAQAPGMLPAAVADLDPDLARAALRAALRGPAR